MRRSVKIRRKKEPLRKGLVKLAEDLSIGLIDLLCLLRILSEYRVQKHAAKEKKATCYRANYRGAWLVEALTSLST